MFAFLCFVLGIAIGWAAFSPSELAKEVRHWWGH